MGLGIANKSGGGLSSLIMHKYKLNNIAQVHTAETVQSLAGAANRSSFCGPSGSQNRLVETAGSSNPSVINNGGVTQSVFPHVR